MTFLLLCGIIISQGLGESSPGYYCTGENVAAHVRLTTEADTLNKTYTGAGWTFGTMTDVTIVPHVTVGGSYRYRAQGNGIAKQKVSLRAGLTSQAHSLVYERELAQTYGSNGVQSITLRLLGSRLDCRISLYRYHTTNISQQHYFGLVTQYGVRIR